jgi:nucleotide-binding universal stress UspA family protein
LTVQNILALLNRIETARPVLVAAELVAGRLGLPRIGVLHVRPAVDPTFLPSEEVMTKERERRFNAATAARSADLRGIFETWQAEVGAHLTADWREIVGKTRSIVAAESRAADLTVIGWAPRDRPEDAGEAISAALFDAGAAILMVPETVPLTIARHPAIAWKSDPKSEKAVAAAKPLLVSADRITVLVGKESEDLETTTDALLRIIAEKSNDVAMRDFELGERHIGEALIAEAHAAGADLLVMGAYSHSRAYEWILGGATREMLAHADLPVFMRH